MKLWLVVLLFCADLAMPQSPGAWQPLEPGQSVEAARRLPVQASAAVVPPPSLQPFRATQSPRIVARREAASVTSRPFAVPLVRTPQVEDAPAVDSDPA